MQAVGRLGSYISKSVYTVSGPFHPFGGAVDIIVVLQPDGSFKSSPWYVRFGKFQGVLKSKEKLVKISVNGVEADFHMNLDRKGEAYFERVVDTEGEDSACSGLSTSGEDTDVQCGDRLKSKSCNDASASLSENVNGSGILRTNSRRSQIFGLVFGNRSKGNGDIQEGCDSNVGRTDSLERAEIAADLLDLNWSTPKGKRDAASRFFAEDVSKDVGENLSGDEIRAVPSSSCQKVGSAVGENNTEYIVETDNSVERVLGDDTTLLNSELTLTDNLSQAKEGVFSEEFIELANGSETELRMNELNLEPEKDLLIGQENSGVQEYLENGDQDTIFQVEKTRITLCSTSESIVTESYMETVHLPQSDISVNELESNGETLLFGELDDVDCRGSVHADGFSSRSKCCSEFSVDQSFVNGYEDTNSEIRGLRSVFSVANINTGGDVQSKELTRAARSLPSMSPISNGLDASLKSEDDYESNDHHSPCVQSMPEDIKITTECKDGTHNPATPPRPSEGSRRSWPFSFSRSRSMKSSPPGPAVIADIENSKEATSTGDSANDLDEDKSTTKANMNKRKIIRAAAPSSEQLASLNLKEGKNIVIFTFSTAMLGQQQVDACIFLWRWDSRIVISDVDGTITRSDLLGQVMPLVGMDWSQMGVAHFFSAIKENGYQFIFLSARSISQAFITRQFLFKIKQDGKALPDGPVVISPDGLFPSLFREVVRRAPHEFKIACLEDIKALFPADTNPFYAGFGNRYTDEFSYLKVGIPRSKIFIINPKGEIVVNRRIDTKSYVSLHSLVHGMFPTMMSSSEQEDFNTWNYWKLPPPTIDD